MEDIIKQEANNLLAILEEQRKCIARIMEILNN